MFQYGPPAPAIYMAVSFPGSWPVLPGLLHVVVSIEIMVRPAGVEPATFCFGDKLD